MAARRRKSRVREAKQALYRQLVLEAAERVFAKKGYDDARMEEIALEAGIALGTLYTVFSGKAELFAAIHEAADEELLMRAVERIRDIADPLEAVLGGVRAYIEYFVSKPDFLRMHLCEGITWGTDAARASGRERSRAWQAGVEMLTRGIERCIEKGIFVEGDPRLLARMMLAMQQVQLGHWLETGMQRDPEEVVQEMCAQVVRSFVRGDAERRS